MKYGNDWGAYFECIGHIIICIIVCLWERWARIELRTEWYYWGEWNSRLYFSLSFRPFELQMKSKQTKGSQISGIVPDFFLHVRSAWCYRQSVIDRNENSMPRFTQSTEHQIGQSSCQCSRRNSNNSTELRRADKKFNQHRMCEGDGGNKWKSVVKRKSNKQRREKRKKFYTDPK